MRRQLTQLFFLCCVCLSTAYLSAQEKSPTPPQRGSLIEERAAKKLLEAGDARLEADEARKAVEVWQSVIERYPRSRIRFTAHMRLGEYFLDRDRAFEKARVHFELATDEDNRSEEQRAAATLKMGVCFYEARNFGKCFQVMRDVIEKFPVSEHVNQAWYYIGLGHFQLGHYSRAIAALEKVGTAVSKTDSHVEKVEAGKRLFVKIEDADLAALEPGTAVKIECAASSGDVEILNCYPVGRNVRIVQGSLPTRLGKPNSNDGILDVKGDDKVTVTYIDEHTADKQFNRKVLYDASVVGDAVVAVTDGAYAETLQGVVLGKSINLQITDADRDLTDSADSISAIIEVHRRKTDEEIEAEQVAAVAIGDADTTDAKDTDIERYKVIDRTTVRLAEVKIDRDRSSLDVDKTEADGDSSDSTTDTTAVTPDATSPNSKDQSAEENSFHSGVFRTTVPLANSDVVNSSDTILQALPGDRVKIVYHDKLNTSAGVRLEIQMANCIEGNLGGVRVTRSRISDRELRVKTRLKTADALTNIGNRYKEFGLKDNAQAKYGQALQLCEEIMREARQLGGRLLEETYVQLWRIYFEMDRLELAAAMAQRLQRDFPNSGFVDDALLQLADVARKQGNRNRAIGVYSRLVKMENSQLRGEAQFGIAECFREMADEREGPQATQLFDKAFQEYKKVFDQFPESGRVGEAVAQMANYYYRQKDYARAIDTFETVLSGYPDAKFLDVILFNYGRCLYRMGRKTQARQRFNQLISDYPESTLAADAKKISDALAKAAP